MPSSSSVLSELDWDEGIAIPVANAENKSLEDEIQKKQKKIVALQTKLGQNVDRIGAIQDHMKNVKQELHHTQNLVNARKKEIDTTEHLEKVIMYIYYRSNYITVKFVLSLFKSLFYLNLGC